jgi:hypothetical protein
MRAAPRKGRWQAAIWAGRSIVRAITSRLPSRIQHVSRPRSPGNKQRLGMCPEVGGQGDELLHWSGMDEVIPRRGEHLRDDGK